MAEIDAFEADLSEVNVTPAEVEPNPAGDEAPPSSETQAVGAAETETPSSDDKVGEDAAKSAAVDAITKAAAPAPGAAKAFTFTANGKPVTVEEAAEIDWKVDGKPEKVKVRDLLDNWSGKTSYDRKFQELSTQRKGFQEDSGKFQRDRERQKTLITDMHKAAGEGRVFDAVANMLEMTGLDKQVDPREYIKQLRDSLVKEAEVLAKLTPDQRQLREEREQREHLQARHTRFVQQRESEQAERTFQERVTKVIEAAKTTPEEFVQTRDFLISEYKKMGKTITEVTPEVIGDQIRAVRAYGVAKDAMDSVDPELTKNQALWEQTVLLMQANPHWTKEDVAGIFQKAVGDNRAKNVNAKLAKSPIATAAKGAVKGKVTPPNPDEDITKSRYSADDMSW